MQFREHTPTVKSHEEPAQPAAPDAERRAPLSALADALGLDLNYVRLLVRRVSQ
jgi:hypothetical protein